MAMLFVVAALWGLGFVFQRTGMDHVGPFTFNSLRFVLGGLSVLPLIWIFSKKNVSLNERRLITKGGVLAGICLFGGISFQQVALVYTTAGKSAFITGMYIIFVPLIGILLGQMVGAKVLVAGVIAFVGLYFLSVTSAFAFEYGDVLTLICAVFWALQVIVTGHYSRKVDGPKFAMVQFITVIMLSLPIALMTETVTWSGIWGARDELLFVGIVGTGFAMTLQILAQKRVPAVQAALIMSLETVFGAFFGWLVLAEVFTTRMLLGSALMLLGIVIAQLPGIRKR